MTPERVLAAVGQPRCFPHRPASVELVQTHLSIVCLADRLVYKLKKAITLPFVDFAPLAARRHACREEVRLNRRLCPDVYVGTSSLRPGADGALQFAATGDDDGPDDVDVAVVMTRLPQSRMLDELVHAGTATTAGIEGLARHVAAFHARCDAVPDAVARATPAELAGFAAANFDELAAVVDQPVAPALLAALAAASRTAFTRVLPALTRRAAAGAVVDGHGDLHARNVCMVEPPAVYDCIEFEPRFRIGDVATEIAFLVMDLRYRGAPALGDTFTRVYSAARGDDEIVSLLPTLCAYRAMVRAKVAAVAAAAPEVPAATRDASRTSCRHHAWLAAALLAETAGPAWLVLSGPPASGKSGICTALADAVCWPVVATDRVRKELAGLAATTRAGPEHYTDAFSERTYTAVLERAAALTRRGEGVVLLDGNFPTPAHRARALAAATAAGAQPWLVHVAVDRATASTRAAARTGDAAAVSDADRDVATTLYDRFVPPRAAETRHLVQLDGTGTPAAAASELLRALLAAPSR